MPLTLEPTNFLNPAFGADHSLPVRKNKDLFDVTAQFAEEKWPSLAKALYVLGIDCPKEAGIIPEQYQASADTMREYLNLGKLLEAPGKWLKNCNTLRNRTVVLLEKGVSLEGAYEWCRGLNSMISPTFDQIDFLVKTRFIEMSKSTFNFLKGINGIGMIINFGTSSIHSLLKFNSNEALETATGEKFEIAKEEAIVTLLQMAYEVSLLAIGILTVMTVFFAAVVPSITWLAFNVSSVVTNLTNYFYQHIGPGLKKNENKGKV